VGFFEFGVEIECEKKRKSWDFVEKPCKREEDLEGNHREIEEPCRCCCSSVADAGNLAKYEGKKWEESRLCRGEGG